MVARGEQKIRKPDRPDRPEPTRPEITEELKKSDFFGEIRSDPKGSGSGSGLGNTYTSGSGLNPKSEKQTRFWIYKKT